MTGQIRGQVSVPVTRYRRDGHLVPIRGQSRWSRARRPDLVGLPNTHRQNAYGITMQLPPARARAWNLALVSVQAVLEWWAHTAGGLSWASIGAALAAVAVLAMPLMTSVVRVHTQRAIRRHHALLQGHLAAHSAGSVGSVEVVDHQSTPHHPDTICAAAAASTLVVDGSVSRTR